ncbi:MAG: PAS domain S-box protein [Candidatus Hydrothermae bacterium]|nr:PAS domain S-box protein [Candidatus Hydrothermae bacterium]
MKVNNFKNNHLLILNSLAEGVWILNKEWKFRFINDAGAKFLGFSPEQIIGQKITELLPELKNSDFLKICKKVRKEPTFKSCPVLLNLPTGSRLLCKIQAYPFIPKGILCIAKDTKKHIELREKVREQFDSMAKMLKKRRKAYLKSEERFETVVKICPLDILIIQDNKFVYTNFSVSSITGASKEEITNLKHFWQAVAPECRQLVRRNYEARLKGEYIPPYEYKVLSKNGKEKWVIVYGSVIEWKGRPADIVMLMDITELKQKELKLQESQQQLQKSLRDFTKALAKMVESRDPYTAGHQERVTELAIAIAKEMGLPKEKIEAIQMAGFLHDMGKIAIPAEILTKPIQLSEIELDLIKTHPRIAYEVLREIDFPWPVAEIIYQHHERWDGSGYPRGLKNDEILLEARILAVADVIEAMSSHRPYRPAHSIEEALEELVRNKWKLYDSEVVDTCVRLFKEKKFSFQSEW